MLEELLPGNPFFTSAHRLQSVTAKIDAPKCIVLYTGFSSGALKAAFQ
jgi:hypothetical protein